MKKCVIGFLCLILVMSCDIPQSITIMGNPELYLDIGSPFKDGARLEDYISPAKIREMMGDQGDIKIYDYLPPNAGQNDPQTYIVHYPIMEMSRDLSEYIDDVFSDDVLVQPFTIPNLPAGLFPSGGYYLKRESPGYQTTVSTTPLFSIQLEDMAKLVIEVNGGPFALELDYNESFYNYLRLRIPAFGINTYIQGTSVGNKLRFVNAVKTKFEPETDMPNGVLEIFVQVLGSCSGTISPQPVFEWTSAKIDTSDHSGGKLSGEYEIDNILGDFLGSGVEFKDVKAYLYVDGIDDNAVLSLKAGTANYTEPLSLRKRPSFTGDSFNQALPPSSISSPINLTGMLNGQGSSKLEYKISMDEMEIKKSEVEEGEKITVDLIILLPLEFKVTTPSSEQGYVKLDLGDIFPSNENGDDLFGRTGEDDDLFNQIDFVKVYIKDLRNTIIDNILAVSIKSGAFNRIIELDLNSNGTSLTIDMDELPPTFSPSFEILLLEDSPGAGATLMMKRQTANNPPVFDFNLAIEAKTDININIKL